MTDIIINQNENNNVFWKLIEKETVEYTKGKSSSVPTEVAREIIRSVLYSINQWIVTKYNGGWEKVPADSSYDLLLKSGRDVVLRKVAIGKRLYRLAMNTRIDISNISYADTLNEINNFFNLYDIKYGAHNVPCMIDYQLIFGNWEEESEGIDFIIMYLERLIWENRFCSFFKKEDMITLYKKYAIDYSEQLINLCDPLYSNAVGSIIAGHETAGINLTFSDQNHIRNRFLTLNRHEVGNLIFNINSFLCEQMGFVNKALDYFEKVAVELISRINNLKYSDGINNIFIVNK